MGTPFEKNTSHIPRSTISLDGSATCVLATGLVDFLPDVFSSSARRFVCVFVFNARRFVCVFVFNARRFVCDRVTTVVAGFFKLLFCFRFVPTTRSIFYYSRNKMREAMEDKLHHGHGVEAVHTVCLHNEGGAV